MLKKVFCILFLFILFCILTVKYHRKIYPDYHSVSKVISPIEFVLDNDNYYRLKKYDTFDSHFSKHNLTLAQKFGITETDAFILGELGKYYARNILSERKLILDNDDIIFNKISYSLKFENSSYCIKDGVLCNQAKFKKELEKIHKTNFVLFDTEKDEYYTLTKQNAQRIKKFLIIPKSHLKKSYIKEFDTMPELLRLKFEPLFSESGNIKVILSDFTVNLKPNNKCTDNICKELVQNINNAQKSIDMAIYGYSSTPQVESAIENAIKRGVKIRIVYDVDSNGKSVYQDTQKLINIIKNSTADCASNNASYPMHNKFYIFDNNIVMTGSANLSYKDMSGFNSNSVIIIKSAKVAEIYEKEFEQMYKGNFHNLKTSINDKNIENISIYFSPKDKPIQNAIVPIVKNAKKYIYIPAFIISDKNLVNELINAKKRGVDVKIIIDALYAANEYSPHEKLRKSGIPLKVENYAGKLHSKALISDDKYLIIGSMNFSSSGSNNNDENIIILTDEKLTSFYKDFFLYQWKKIPDKWLKYNPRAESLDSYGSCFDGEDNNYNDLIDSQEPACNRKDILNW